MCECERCEAAQERFEALDALERAQKLVNAKMPEWTRTRPRTYIVAHEEMASLAAAVRRLIRCELTGRDAYLIDVLGATCAFRDAILRHAPHLDPWRGIARELDDDPQSSPVAGDRCAGDGG